MSKVGGFAKLSPYGVSMDCLVLSIKMFGESVATLPISQARSNEWVALSTVMVGALALYGAKWRRADRIQDVRNVTPVKREKQHDCGVQPRR